MDFCPLRFGVKPSGSRVQHNEKGLAEVDRPSMRHNSPANARPSIFMTLIPDGDEQKKDSDNVCPAAASWREAHYRLGGVVDALA